MKNLFKMTTALLLLAGCMKQEMVDPAGAGLSPVFTASFEDAATKTSVDSDLHLFWTEDDRLSIFTNTYNQQYRFMGKTGDNAGDFEEVKVSGFHSGSDLDRNYALYPYADSTKISYDGTFTCTLPAVQAYAQKSFGLGANTMVAVTQAPDDYFLSFKNVCGYLAVKLYGEGRVKSIELTGNNGEKIAGAATVAASYGQDPVTTMLDTATETITIDCGESGVALGTSSTEATEFWFCIPPVTFSQGFTMRVTDTEGKFFEKGVTTSRTITRNVVNSLSALKVTFMPDPKDLSADGTANCYIVSEYGSWKFDATKKGHTSETVGAIVSAEVLWESSGNDVQPQVGDIVSNVSVKDGFVRFNASGNDGNAVIAVKDAAGDILWSWHIWVCEGFDPAATAQVYYNNAGTVMDRNLGATSAAKGDVRALGLLYQWGRKDPFLGGQSIGSNTKARSTISWPSPVSSDASNGTIDYVVKHPTTFVTSNSSNYDWYYTGSSSTDNTRWNPDKGMYDPCPKGWRVADGGRNGHWSTALGSSSSFEDGPWDSTNKGMDFTGRFSTSSAVWYPASGYLYGDRGALQHVGYYGRHWSCTPNGVRAGSLLFNDNDSVSPSFSDDRSSGISVRCVKESVPGPEPEAKNLSTDGTANCYIVSEYGSWKFDATKKGHTSETVGAIVSAEVLWESFGNDVQPQVGGIVSNVSVKDGFVRFNASGNDGNAVIAVKDAAGDILWSWHIWVCEGFDPAATAQVYYNNAGTVMDRNLGATSAAKGDVRALGLLYQWGRKDPFLSGGSISSSTQAKSTISWPSPVFSDTSIGTIDYAVKHPTTFVMSNSNNDDWYYTGSSSTDNTRWNPGKGMYDPCPNGWRVPDGGDNGLWSTALGSSPFFSDGPWNNTNKGMDFAGRFSASSEVWYPASGYLGDWTRNLNMLGSSGRNWSCTPDGYYAFSLSFYSYGDVYTSGVEHREYGQSVRCLKE